MGTLNTKAFGFGKNTLLCVCPAGRERTFGVDTHPKLV